MENDKDKDETPARFVQIAAGNSHGEAVVFGLDVNGAVWYYMHTNGKRWVKVW